ncbi:hypothetical protein [Pseudomonas panipatensis]|uniref:hypothetical protein n=1 Tax=Pseudomonas panipatensis TaxID=428992 RepID=UPI0035B3EB06
MNPAIQRLQDLLDQELQSAIACDRPVDYRQVFLGQLGQATLSDSDWIALSLSLLLAIGRGVVASDNSSAPSTSLNLRIEFDPNLPLHFVAGMAGAVTSGLAALHEKGSIRRLDITSQPHELTEALMKAMRHHNQ